MPAVRARSDGEWVLHFSRSGSLTSWRDVSWGAQLLLCTDTRRLTVFVVVVANEIIYWQCYSSGWSEAVLVHSMLVYWRVLIKGSD